MSGFMGPDGLLVEIEAPAFAPPGQRYFRGRIDRNQKLYVLIQLGNGFFFEIHDGAGNREIYGATPESQESHDGLTVQWNLNAIVDAYGNAAVFTYFNRNNVSYVQSIELVNRWQSAAESVSYSVQFAYEDRPDTWRYFGFGIPQTFDLRLRSVKTFWVPGSRSLDSYRSSPESTENQPIRSYLFQYDQKGPTHRSVLARLDIMGASGKEYFPGYSFAYAEDHFSSPDFHRSALSMAGLPSPNLLFWNDFNRDGLADAFSFSRENGWQIWFNLGDTNGFSDPKQFPIENLSIQNGVDSFVDLNLDFSPDILRWDSQNKRNMIYLSDGSESIWSTEPVAVKGIDFWVGGRLPVDWVDFNNDRLVDLVRYEVNGGKLSLHIYQNNSRDGQISFQSAKVLDVMTKVVVPPEELEWLDFNGDGLEDLFYLAKGAQGPVVRYHPNMGQLLAGTGTYGTPDLPFLDLAVLDAQNRPIRLTLDLKSNTRLADINSDGLPDLVYYSRGSLRYFISDGTSLRESNQWADATLTANTLFFETGDTNANGSQELLFLTKNREMVSLDLYHPDRDHTPYLLESVTSDSGWQDRYFYRSSLRGKTAAYYSLGWSPTTTQVLAKIQRFALTTTPASGVRHQLISSRSFDYASPRFGRSRREFLGFADVQTRLDHDASGRQYTLIERSFYTDEEDTLLQGFMSSQKQSFIDLDHADQTRRDYEIVQQTGAVTKLLALSPVYFPYIAKATRTIRESGLSKTMVTTHEYEFDGTGKPIQNHAKEYDADNRPYRIQRTEFERNERAGQWDQGQVHQVEILGQSGQILQAKRYDHDERGSIKQMSAFRDGAFEQVASLDYDAWGNPLRVTDALDRARWTEFESDGRFLPSASLSKAGNVVLKRSVQWNYVHESPAAITDENNHTSTTRYDDLGRIIELTLPDQSSPFMSMRYQQSTADQLGQIETSVRGRSGKDIQYFDSVGRTVIAVQPSEAGSIIQNYQTFDLLGRPLFVGTAFALPPNQTLENFRPDPSLAIAYQWDYQSRILSVTEPRTDLEKNSVQTTRFEYGLDFFRVINAENETKTQHKDHFGRVFKTVDHAGDSASTDRSVVVKHDELDRVVELQLSNLARRRFLWNARDQLTELEAETGLYRFHYDAAGQLQSREVFDAQRKYQGSYAFTYDEVGRVTAQYFSNAAEGSAVDLEKARLVYRSYYDSWAEIPTLNHNQKGRLAGLCMEDNSCFQYSYHPWGMVARETVRLGSTPAREMFQMLYNYDQNGRLDSLIYPDGETVSHVYSPVTGRLVSIPGLVENTAYDDLNRPTGMTLNPQFKMDFTYYKNLGVVREAGTRLRDKRTSQEISYDRLGRVVGIQGSDPWFDHMEKTYAYDALGQLTQAHYDLNGKNSKSFNKNFNYSYDNNGFMTEFDGKAVQFEHRPVVTADQLLSKVSVGDAVYDFDEAGRLASIHQAGKPALSLRWTADNRLTSKIFADGTSIRFIDRPDRERFSEEKFDPQSQKVSHIFYINPFVQYDQIQKTLTKYYRYGKAPVARRRGSAGEITYMLTDVLGSVKGEVNTSGELLNYREFTPYGEPIVFQAADGLNRHGFAGYFEDADSATYQLQQRHYIPALGLFMSPDPLYLASSSSCLASALNCNLYSYAQNDPVNFVDFDGLMPKKKVVKKSSKQHAESDDDSDSDSSSNSDSSSGESSSNSQGARTRATTDSSSDGGSGNFGFDSDSSADGNQSQGNSLHDMGFGANGFFDASQAFSGRPRQNSDDGVRNRLAPGIRGRSGPSTLQSVDTSEAFYNEDRNAHASRHAGPDMRLRGIDANGRRTPESNVLRMAAGVLANHTEALVGFIGTPDQLVSQYLSEYIDNSGTRRTIAVIVYENGPDAGLVASIFSPSPGQVNLWRNQHPGYRARLLYERARESQ